MFNITIRSMFCLCTISLTKYQRKDHTRAFVSSYNLLFWVSFSSQWVQFEPLFRSIQIWVYWYVIHGIILFTNIILKRQYSIDHFSEFLIEINWEYILFCINEINFKWYSRDIEQHNGPSINLSLVYETGIIKEQK